MTDKTQIIYTTGDFVLLEVISPTHGALLIQINIKNEDLEQREINITRLQWKAEIDVNNHKSHLGYFTTEEEARAANRAAKLVYHSLRRRGSWLHRLLGL